MFVPEHHRVPLLPEDVVDADVLRREPPVGVGDVVCVVDRLSEDQSEEVRGGVDLTAPPVAVLATKSSGPPSRTGLALRQAVVAPGE